jgi:hypothetical protein
MVFTKSADDSEALFSRIALGIVDGIDSAM